ncbi:hypothetical protein SLA2020_303580 [Shorea laevis]
MGLLKIHGDHGGLPKVFGDHWGTTKCSLWPPQSRWKFMARPLRLCQKFIAAMTMLPEVHGSHRGSTGSSRRPRDAPKVRGANTGLSEVSCHHCGIAGRSW